MRLYLVWIFILDDKNEWLQAEFEKRLKKIEDDSKKTALKVSIMLWLGLFLLVAWVLSSALNLT